MCTEMLAEASLKQGSYNAHIFYPEQRKLRTVIHGYDFATLGKKPSVAWLGAKDGGEVQRPTIKRQAKTGEDIEQDRDNDGGGVRVRGVPEACEDHAE